MGWNLIICTSELKFLKTYSFNFSLPPRTLSRLSWFSADVEPEPTHLRLPTSPFLVQPPQLEPNTQMSLNDSNPSESGLHSHYIFGPSHQISQNAPKFFSWNWMKWAPQPRIIYRGKLKWIFPISLKRRWGGGKRAVFCSFEGSFCCFWQSSLSFTWLSVQESIWGL